MVITKIHSAVVDILRENGDWMSRDDIMKAMRYSHTGSKPGNILMLEELFQSGEIAKRLKPGGDYAVTYEYRYLPEKRTRPEIIKNILCEYYNGQWVRLRDIAAALGETGNQLSSPDYDYFLDLLKDPNSGLEREIGNYSDRDAEPKYRCLPQQ